jgi:hypothetical protein
MPCHSVLAHGRYVYKPYVTENINTADVTYTITNYQLPITADVTYTAAYRADATHYAKARPVTWPHLN